ncbi:MAG: Gfo/Idh/MocA family oxidoreductase [Oscillospiraceae bacterium]|nr:Gfo/Idh/MocA family oxidoreductase [Oscillospiraceae bacterium]
MKKYKWGILGPGNIARRFTGGLSLLPDTAVKYAVGSRDIGRARAFADEHGYEKAYGSYAELVADPDVDIIYVATPHPQHAEAAILCLEAKKAVLCEKPFAATAPQAARMVASARENGVFLMEAMWTRFLPTIVKVRELIADGAIGRPLHVYADFAFRSAVNPKGRLFNPDAAGGSLLDVGVYNISFCNMIFGKQPDRVLSHLAIGETGVDESASVIFNYSGGESATLFSAVRVSTAHDAAIYGEDGYIKLPAYWHGDTILLNNKDGAQEIKAPFVPTGFQYEATEVMSCLDKGLLESPTIPLDETLTIMGLLDKIRFDNNLRYPFERGQ